MKIIRKHRRRWPVVVIFLAAVSILGCSEDRSSSPANEASRTIADPSAAGSGTVVVYSASNNSRIGPVLEAYTAETGIKINLVVDDYEKLVARIERSGSGSVADLLIGSSVGDLWDASEKDIYRPVYSMLVADQIPERLRDAEKVWHALAGRARIAVYNQDVTDAGQIATVVDYASLGDDTWRGKICLSASGVQGNRSLIAFLIMNHGARNAELIVRGWLANLAAPVFNSDSELLQAIADGTCAMGIADSNDLAAFVRSRPGIPLAAHWFADGSPVYVDVTGAGVTRHAENPQGATALLEWLTSEQPNALFAALGREFPANSNAPLDASLVAWSGYVTESMRVSGIGYFLPDADKLAERAHYP